MAIVVKDWRASRVRRCKFVSRHRLTINGLRDYSTEPLVWSGRGDCAHEWGEKYTGTQNRHHVTGEKSDTFHGGKTTEGQLIGSRQISQGQFCRHCQAWRGSLGLEPTLDMYVAHLVEIFRDVRRVLSDTGILICNLGDSYSKGDDGLPAKNLLGIPWRVALALQADGWILRSAMPWLKASAMPESVQDRPTTAHEYVFLLSKSKKYYWDADAIRQPAAVSTKERDLYRGRGNRFYHGGNADPKGGGFRGKGGLENERDSTKVGRNYRTTDAYIAPLEYAIEQARDEVSRLETMRDTTGLLLDEEGNPVALRVNPGNFKGSHFATFPVGLVEPFVSAGSSEKGQCPECNGAWVRVVERKGGTIGKSWHDHSDDAGQGMNQVRHFSGGVGKAKDKDGKPYTVTTIGWRPSCDCPSADPIPQTILDIFGGAMTTMMVADRLGRDGIACELNPDYAEMGRERLVADGGMFINVRVE